jgi:hypothetical protein
MTAGVDDGRAALDRLCALGLEGSPHDNIMTALQFFAQWLRRHPSGRRQVHSIGRAKMIVAATLF